MINIEYVTGDLIQIIKDGECDVTAHGCNCFHIMGGGVAAQLRQLDPSVFKADLATPHGDINKLGSYSVGYYKGETKTVSIYNIYTQHSTAFDDNSVHVHWDSVFNGLYDIIDSMEDGQVLAIPYIGCGLANGKEEEYIVGRWYKSTCTKSGDYSGCPDFEGSLVDCLEYIRDFT